jgi:hypothetical protein
MTRQDVVALLESLKSSGELSREMTEMESLMYGILYPKTKGQVRLVVWANAGDLVGWHISVELYVFVGDIQESLFKSNNIHDLELATSQLEKAVAIFRTVNLVD